MSADLPDLSAISIESTPANLQDNINVGQDFSDGFDDVGGLADFAEPLAPVKSESELKEEFEERIILQLYNSKFPTELSIIASEFASINSKNIDQLKELRKKCDVLLGASSASENKKRMFNMCIYGLEKATTSMGYDTTGLTGQLLNDIDFQRDLMRLSLKYLSAEESQPELTVPLKLLTTMVQTNANNETKTKIVENTTVDASQPTPAVKANLTTINQKFSDL